SDRICRAERRELADRMADDVIRLDPPGTQRRIDREARRHERRLLHLRLHQLVVGAGEAQPLQVEPARGAADVVDGHRSRLCLGDLAAHAGVERALAREHEGDLWHSQAPFVSWVHSIKAEPHVRPAPIPVISTSFPGFRRPSSDASARASGIDPDDVLPYRSTFTTTFSSGNPSFFAAWSMIRTLAWCGT